MSGWRSVRGGNLAGFAACAAMLAYALYTQRFGGLEPCNFCMLQRFAVGALGLAFLLAGLVGARGAALRAVLALPVLAFAAVTAALAGRHVWVQAQPAGSLPSCGADFWTMVDMMPWVDVVKKILHGGAECQRIDWTFLGLSMPAWVLIAALLLAVWAILVNFRPRTDASA
jgi:disulfide bond formation protein DsbB